MSARSIASVLMLSLACTAFALVIYFRLIKTLGALGVASQSYLRSGIGVLLGVLLLGERPSATSLFGLVIIIVGVALMTTNSKIKKAL